MEHFIRKRGINNMMASVINGADEDAKVNVYTTDGKLVRSAVKRNAALQGLPSGVYVVDGKKCVK